MKSTCCSLVLCILSSEGTFSTTRLKTQPKNETFHLKMFSLGKGKRNNYFSMAQVFPHATGEKKSLQGKNILRYSIVGNRLDLRVRPIFVLFILLFSGIYVSVISIVFKLLSGLAFFAVLFVAHHCIVLILGKFGSPHPGKAQQP